MSSFESTVLSVANLSHSYGRHSVLKNLSFSLSKGEILGIIGENGAGKSTLVKCILGMLHPSSGEISLRTSAAAIHQELNLANDLPVYANFFLGREIYNAFGLLDLNEMMLRTTEALQLLCLSVSSFVETSSLSVSEKQLLEIARALDVNAGILILDEPSALLNSEETSRLFSIMRRLKERGTAMIYISHKLDEICEICDSVAILRDGELVGAGSASSLSPREMAEKMVGRSLADIYPPFFPPSNFEALSFSSPSFGSFSLHAGEILGVAGLADAGQIDLGETIAGFRPSDSASIMLNGHPTLISSPAEALRAGIGYLTPDRLAAGIWRDFSIAENIALGSLSAHCPKKGIVSFQKVNQTAQAYIQNFTIRCQSASDPASALSGGNQQKVAMAKVLSNHPSVVILNEPTQGVDVGARQEIYSCISKLAANGLAILIVSSDLPELLGLCQRVLVMREGRIAGELSKPNLSEKAIIRIATGTEQ